MAGEYNNNAPALSSRGGHPSRPVHVDLGVPPRDPKQAAVDHWEDLLTLAHRLESLWPDRRLDLVVLGHQGPLFCHQVLLEGRLLYDADPDRRVDFFRGRLDHLARIPHSSLQDGAVQSRRGDLERVLGVLLASLED